LTRRTPLDVDWDVTTIGTSSPPESPVKRWTVREKEEYWEGILAVSGIFGEEGRGEEEIRCCCFHLWDIWTSALVVSDTCLVRFFLHAKGAHWSRHGGPRPISLYDINSSSDQRLRLRLLVILPVARIASCQS
jgi:hypothetical protein